jgi:hypothetical protein
MAETITREQAREETRAMVQEMRDLLKNEELWAVAQRYLNEAFKKGYAEGLVDGMDEE